MDNIDDSTGNSNDDFVEVIEDGDDVDFDYDGDNSDIGYEDDDASDAEDDKPGDERMEIQDEADLTFSKHSSSIFCCDLQPTAGTFAVSGGEDDCALVWNTADGQVLFKCTDHRDSVICASFSHDGTLVATGDMCGIVQVWDVNSKSRIWDTEISDLSWLHWHHASHVLLAGTVCGDQYMWKIPSGDCKIFASHGSQSSCARILADGKRSVSGYSDGSVKVWSLKEANALHHIKDNFGHRQDVISIDANSDGNLILSGSADGTAKLINSTTGRVINTVGTLRTNEEEKCSLEDVKFSPLGGLFATADLSGALCIYDLSTQVQRLLCRHERGIVKLIWDSMSPLIYTGSLDGVVRLWDARTGTMVNKWSGHTEDILDITLSKDGNTILTASDDQTCKLFYTSRPDR